MLGWAAGVFADLDRLALQQPVVAEAMAKSA
jgi:hypothetical protein